MRPNRYIILLSLLLGAAGAWFTADAVGQYLNTARSFASVHAQYVEDSFVWEDPQHERAHVRFRITNNSDNDANLSHFSVNVYFDGTFAGARYDQWEAIEIPAGETIEVESPILISISELRPQGSEAEISMNGRLRLEFEGIERPMTVPTRGMIGQVPYEENSQ
jgi:hypothetical protein